jgi:hypothetical protein
VQGANRGLVQILALPRILDAHLAQGAG